MSKYYSYLFLLIIVAISHLRAPQGLEVLTVCNSLLIKHIITGLELIFLKNCQRCVCKCMFWFWTKTGGHCLKTLDKTEISSKQTPGPYFKILHGPASAFSLYSGPAIVYSCPSLSLPQFHHPQPSNAFCSFNGLAPLPGWIVPGMPSQILCMTSSVLFQIPSSKPPPFWLHQKATGGATKGLILVLIWTWGKGCDGFGVKERRNNVGGLVEMKGGGFLGFRLLSVA